MIIREAATMSANYRLEIQEIFRNENYINFYSMKKKRKAENGDFFIKSDIKLNQ